MKIELEDSAEDIVAKLARCYGLEPQQVLEPCKARELGLDLQRLGALAHYPQAAALPPCWHQYCSEFYGGVVNVWVFEAHKGAEALVFDAGVDAALMQQIVRKHHCAACFITHAHADHMAGVPVLKEHGVPVLAPLALPGAELFAAGGQRQLAGVWVRSFDLQGHAKPANGYALEYGHGQFAIVGDSLFAGSMGKCATPADFARAKQGLAAMLGALRRDCLLLPGHGRHTSSALELAHNPLLAGLL